MLHQQMESNHAALSRRPDGWKIPLTIGTSIPHKTLQRQVTAWRGVPTQLIRVLWLRPGGEHTVVKLPPSARQFASRVSGVGIALGRILGTRFGTPCNGRWRQ